MLIAQTAARAVCSFLSAIDPKAAWQRWTQPGKSSVSSGRSDANDAYGNADGGGSNCRGIRPQPTRRPGKPLPSLALRLESMKTGPMLIGTFLPVAWLSPLVSLKARVLPEPTPKTFASIFNAL
jgi:hypothetical protein